MQMSLNCNLQVTLHNIPAKKAHTVQRALEPDNINFPKNLRLEIKNIKNSNKLVLYFNSRGDMSHLIGTVDEVLQHIQIALKVIK